ncbi:hypothetical protein E2C01_020279 [Portunus trituberculatus]|uniref:Uncharacterized protein n=1 Tax=Portunus trituberculatus TaxID=210409 RepID=A0A5B7E029_PORTR|nr:hypothetical protein [Portunus trituberculatus]
MTLERRVDIDTSHYDINLFRSEASPINQKRINQNGYWFAHNLCVYNVLCHYLSPGALFQASASDLTVAAYLDLDDDTGPHS